MPLWTGTKLVPSVRKQSYLLRVAYFNGKGQLKTKLRVEASPGRGFSLFLREFREDEVESYVDRLCIHLGIYSS